MCCSTHVLHIRVTRFFVGSHRGPCAPGAARTVMRNAQQQHHTVDTPTTKPAPCNKHNQFKFQIAQHTNVKSRGQLKLNAQKKRNNSIAIDTQLRFRADDTITESEMFVDLCRPTREWTATSPGELAKDLQTRFPNSWNIPSGRKDS